MRHRPLALSIASIAAAAVVLSSSAGVADPASPASASSARASAGPAAEPAKPAKPAKPLAYVALGDSYSAASGVLPPDPSAFPGCLRSTLNYPHLIASRLGADFTDVTCGGAQTKDYAGSQYPGAVGPQLDALGRRTRLVTMTIGGNDGNVFIGSIVACGAAGATTAGQGNPCQTQYGDSFATTVRTSTYPALVSALQAVHAKAPKAKVAIIGYPWIVPQTTGCYPILPVASGDVPYLRSLQATLNDAVKRAARATGSTYVNMNRVSNGHDACQPIGTRWVEPVVGTTNPVIVHPNALGEQALARQTLRVLRRHR